MTKLIATTIRLYRLFVSGWLPPACRFYPSCSVYTEEAVRDHGWLRGSWLGLRRLSRCHPLGTHGYDPVPRVRSGEAGSRR